MTPKLYCYRVSLRDLAPQPATGASATEIAPDGACRQRLFVAESVGKLVPALRERLGPDRQVTSIEELGEVEAVAK